MNMSEQPHLQNTYAHATLRGELRLDEPMSRHVSWRAGGRNDRNPGRECLSDDISKVLTVGRQDE